MSRGFDLIRRHLDGLKAVRAGASAPVGEAVSGAGARRQQGTGFAPADPARTGSAWRSGTGPRVSQSPPAGAPAPPRQPIVERTRPEALRPEMRRAVPSRAPISSGARDATDRGEAGPVPEASPARQTTAPHSAPTSAPYSAPDSASDSAPDSSSGTGPPPPDGPTPPRSETRKAPPAATPRRERQAFLGAIVDPAKARAARRHSLFVSLMKGLLPVTALVLAGVFVFYSIDFRPALLPENLAFDPGKVSVESEGIRMVAPKLTGVDDRQQTFEISASAATQDRADPARVTLEGIDARINLAEGGVVGFSADHGLYNTDLNQIWLRSNLEVRSSEGYVAQLSEAQVDFKNGLMVSNNPVRIFTDRGEIQASGVQVFDGGERMRFMGRVTVDLRPPPESGGRR